MRDCINMHIQLLYILVVYKYDCNLCILQNICMSFLGAPVLDPGNSSNTNIGEYINIAILAVSVYASSQEYIRDKSVQPRILACITTVF